MVSPAFLRPVIDILDQSSQYLALVAMRPGHAARVIGGSEHDAVAGDHFDIIHLGIHPYSQEWVDFMLQAVSAQIQESRITPKIEELRHGVISLARDSVRTALELFGWLCADGSVDPVKNLRLGLEDLRESTL